MLKFILLGVVIVLVVFAGFVASRPALFSYSESTLIKASPEKIYPYLGQLKLGGEWSPYEKRDPAMKKEFSGIDGTPGSKLVFDGKKDVGAGSVEILSLIPNQEVSLRLLMTRPMKADNLITYKLDPVGEETRFTWTMEGENGFIGKLFVMLVDCEAMLSKDMNEGFANLRKIVE
jgi:hypothetical protein